MVYDIALLTSTGPSLRQCGLPRYRLLCAEQGSMLHVRVNNARHLPNTDSGVGELGATTPLLVIWGMISWFILVHYFDKLFLELRSWVICLILSILSVFFGATFVSKTRWMRSWCQCVLAIDARGRDMASVVSKTFFSTHMSRSLTCKRRPPIRPYSPQQFWSASSKTVFNGTDFRTRCSVHSRSVVPWCRFRSHSLVGQTADACNAWVSGSKQRKQPVMFIGPHFSSGKWIAKQQLTTAFQNFKGTPWNTSISFDFLILCRWACRVSVSGLRSGFLWHFSRFSGSGNLCPGTAVFGRLLCGWPWGGSCPACAGSSAKCSCLWDEWFRRGPGNQDGWNLDRWASLEDLLTHQVFSCFFDVGLCVFLGGGGGQGKPNTWILRVFERSQVLFCPRLFLLGVFKFRLIFHIFNPMPSWDDDPKWLEPN